MNEKNSFFIQGSLHEMPLVILCGGKSSRMKEDKALLPFSNASSLAKFQYKRLFPYFQNICLSSKTNKFDFDCELLLEKSDIYSPLIALQSILEQLEAPKVFILTVDTPLVTISSINKLIEESKSFDICVAQTKRLHSLTGVFSKSILPVINKMLDDDMHKIGYLLKSVNTKIVDFKNDDEFINLNHQEDYARAKELIKSSS